MNYHCIGEGGVSYGCNICLNDMRNILGYKKNTYSNQITDYYKTVKSQNKSDEEICFTKVDGHNYGKPGVGVFLNHTMWNWTQAQNQTVVWDVIEVNSTYNRSRSRVEWNDTEDLWVKKI